MSLNIIDFLKEHESIKQKFGSRYFAEKKAVQMAADFWGAQSNKHGVFVNCKKEIICEVKRCRGEFEYVSTSKGYWLIGVSAQTSISGFGYAPSVWSRYGFKSYHDARLAAVIELHDFFNQKSGISSQSQNDEIQKILALLQSEKTPQLNLF